MQWVFTVLYFRCIRMQQCIKPFHHGLPFSNVVVEKESIS